MKILLAGAYGKLGGDILKLLSNTNNQIIACDLKEREIEGLNKDNVTFKQIDVTNTETLKGICLDVDVLISTVGLTTKSQTLTSYDIDYQGNLNLLNEAIKNNIKKFIYISVIKADIEKKAPMVLAKYMFEKELEKSGIPYIIYRPTGYMYDIVKVFKPMVLNGRVTLLGKKNYKCNLVNTLDFAEFIINHIDDSNKIYNIGGIETYTYEEIANMCFNAINKKPVIKRAPTWIFDLLAKLPKNKKNGTSSMLYFSKFTLTNDLVGDTLVGSTSFKEYVKEAFKR